MSDHLQFIPCFPISWPSVSVRYRYGRTNYAITVFQKNDIPVSTWKIDNVQGEGDTIRLTDDGIEHQVELRIKIKSTQ